MNTKRPHVSRVLKTAACAGVLGIGLMMASTANASLVTFNLVATGGNNVTVDASGKNVTVTGSNASVNYAIQAVVHGTGDNSDDGVDELMLSVHGSGNLAGSQVGHNIAPFNSGDSLPGTPNGTSLGFDNGTAFLSDGTSFFGQSATTTPVLGTVATSGDFVQTIGTATFNVSGTSGSTTLQAVPHIDASAGTGGRFEQFILDGHSYVLNGNGSGRLDGAVYSNASAFDTGAPITISATPAPEPTSLALLGLGGFGLLMRRRK
jgi:hypothetical protein